MLCGCSSYCKPLLRMRSLTCCSRLPNFGSVCICGDFSLCLNYSTKECELAAINAETVCPPRNRVMHNDTGLVMRSAESTRSSMNLGSARSSVNFGSSNLHLTAPYHSIITLYFLSLTLVNRIYHFYPISSTNTPLTRTIFFFAQFIFRTRNRC